MMNFHGSSSPQIYEDSKVLQAVFRAERLKAEKEIEYEDSETGEEDEGDSESEGECEGVCMGLLLFIFFFLQVPASDKDMMNGPQLLNHWWIEGRYIGMKR